MYIKKIDQDNKTLSIAIPLTKGTDKTRIKTRLGLQDFGVIASTCKEPFSLNNYVEWQIGYDAILGRIDKNGNEIKTPNKKALLKLEKTQLQNKKFIGSNGKLKCFYELSEYIQFFYDFKIISKNDLLNIKTYLQNTDKNNYLDNLKIKRTNFTNKNLNGIDYLYAEVEYPVLVYKFGKYEVYTEIIIQEQQYARGVQPMLFFCFPITELKTQSQLIGRVANRNEEAEFIINKDNIFVFLEMLKIFGNLSTNHNKDILSIINKII